MGTELWAVMRVVFYCALIFLVLFDLPAVRTHGHRVVLWAILFWLAMLLGASLALSLGWVEWWLWFRDVGLTLGVGAVTLAHIYWLARRDKHCE